MAKRYKFQTEDENGKGPEFEGEFSDEEWGLLERYCRFFDEFADIALCRRGLDFGFSIVWNAKGGWEPADTSRLPAPIELREFLYMFRPLLLENEPTYFGRVLSVIRKRIPHRAWNHLTDQFDGTRFQRTITITLTPAPSPGQPKPTDVVLNSAKTLKRWLNAFEYHRDVDKALAFSEIHADDFPTPDHIKGIMLELLREKAIAAAKLRQLIATFGEGNGASFTIGEPKHRSS